MRKSVRVVAFVAVAVLVLAAGAGAAGRYIITSTHQIKPSVLHRLRGARGPRGFTGAQGLSGPAASVQIHQAAGPSASMCESGTGCEVASSVASCPPGTVVVGGGWDGESSPPVEATASYDQPLGSGAWEVIMTNNSSFVTASFNAVATCAGGGASAARAGLTAAQRAQVARDLAAARSLAR